MIIAIDGPAAAGKGTLARRLAKHLNFAYLDTGSLYRAVGLKLLRQNKSASDQAAALDAVRTLTPEDLQDPSLRDDAVAAMASGVAVLPEVRAALLGFQRNFALSPPVDGARGSILDGRDTGTVVCPDADLKLFVTADVTARATRRFQELETAGQDVRFQTVLDEMIARDARDSKRSAAPLTRAQDAHLLDTTNSDIDSVFQTALKLVSSKMPTK